MLLRAGLPDRSEYERWAVEVKFDGMRGQFRLDEDGWSLRSRPGRDCTDEFPEISALADHLDGLPVILDGELVCLDEQGAPDFHRVRSRLQSRGDRSGRAPATLIVFDVLYLDGQPLLAQPYEERRRVLHDLLGDGPVWRTPRHWVATIDEVCEITRDHQLEGVVCKRLDSAYRPGKRSGGWLKHKHRRRELLAVTGWAQRDDEPDVLYLGRVVGGRRKFAGTAQFGLDEEGRRTLRAALRSHAAPRRPRRPIRDVRPGVWVEVDCHGVSHRPIRDAVIRDVIVSP